MRPALLSLCALCALLLAACSDTVQSAPVADSALEGLIDTPFPVYWAGGSFQGMAISETAQDSGGAISVLYGRCVQGGQYACVAPLRVVSSPDNSFLPGSTAPHLTRRIRGVSALVAQGGRTIVIATGPVVLDIYATSARLASAAAQALVAINAAGWPEEALPARLPDTGYAARPLGFQAPPRLEAPP